VIVDYYRNPHRRDAVRPDSRWNAEVRTLRLFSQDKPHVATALGAGNRLLFVLASEHARRSEGLAQAHPPDEYTRAPKRARATTISHVHGGDHA
jgi:hypothetical protein